MPLRFSQIMPIFSFGQELLLCQEDPYLLELVRYIHLNPLRVLMVKDLTALDSYPYSGHAVIMGICERTHALKIRGIDFAAVREHVAWLFNIDGEEIFRPGKYRNRVAARSVLCYFLVRDLGMTATAVAERFRISQPAVSIAVARGEAIVCERGLTLPEGANNIL